MEVSRLEVLRLGWQALNVAALARRHGRRAPPLLWAQSDTDWFGMRFAPLISALSL